MALAAATAQLPALRSLAKSDHAKARELVNKLKVLMTEFPSQSGSSISTPSRDEAAVAREILELALLVSIDSGDLKSFERNFAQLRPYYSGALGAAADKAGRQHVLGLYLMHLLVDNRLAEFHSEVELLHAGDRDSVFVAFPLQLETYLAEGSYNKILSSRGGMPSAHYAAFVDRLVTTAREDIADCAAASYSTLSLAAAQKLMMFDSQAQLTAFLAASKPDWRVAAGVIHFASSEKARADVDSIALITNTLHYATELERIV